MCGVRVYRSPVICVGLVDLRSYLIRIVIPILRLVISKELLEHASDELTGRVDGDVGRGVDVDALVSDLRGRERGVERGMWRGMLDVSLVESLGRGNFALNFASMKTGADICPLYVILRHFSGD